MGVYWVMAVASSWVMLRVKDSGDSYSSAGEFMVVMMIERERNVCGDWFFVFCSVDPSFMLVRALLLRWGIGDRSRRLVLGRVSGVPQVPRCCHSWGNPST